MPKSKGFKIIENLRAIFENRPHKRDGTLTYLTEVYRTVRKHPWITDDVDLELEREPRITNLFAHMIEVTSDLTPKMRSKYAKVLRIADEHKIRFRDFETFVKSKGGFNAVIEKFRSKRRKFASVGQWQ